MKDMMMEVYNRLIDNPLIREKTSFINDNGSQVHNPV
ncbi:gp10 family protein [Enterococcus faecalis]|nr:gp10 family protein [Enterococcus faecalis]